MDKVVAFLILSCGASPLLVYAATAPAPVPLYSSWNVQIKYTPGPGAVIPACTPECKKTCTLGLDVCTGMRTFLDTTKAKLSNDPSDPNFYAYCACQKSTIVRTPGKICGPGTTGLGRPGIKCPATSPWVDGFNTTIKDSQGTTLQALKAAGLA